jgi:hypothetical protein
MIDSAKAIVGAAPVIFGPRTLGRTWGTRPIPSAFHWAEAFISAGCYDPSVSESIIYGGGEN